MEILSPKIVINLNRTYKKPHCKGEPYKFSRYQNPSLLTDRQIKILLLLYNDIHLSLLQDKGKGRKGGAGAQFLDYEAQLSGSDEGSDAHRYHIDEGSKGIRQSPIN